MHAMSLRRTAYLDKSVTGIINSFVANEITATKTDDDAIESRPRRKARIRVIVMGGGYDTRSLKILERYLLLKNDEKNRTDDISPPKRLLRRKVQPRQHVQLRFWKRSKRGRFREDGLKREKQSHSFDDSTTSLLSLTSLSSSKSEYNLECYELDLPEVVRAKRQLIQTRLQRRRPWLKQMTTGIAGEYPYLIPVNLNDVNETRNALEGILQIPSSPSGDETGDDNIPGCDDDITNIILFEGVMIYLDEGIPHSLLQLCSDVLNERINTSMAPGASSSSSSSSGYLCFADRLDNIPGGDIDAAHVELASTGWELLDWLPKPGLARHMGVARLRTR
jgi:hypothetical protein